MIGWRRWKGAAPGRRRASRSHYREQASSPWWGDARCSYPDLGTARP
jgi:hypothetical protein